MSKQFYNTRSSSPHHENHTLFACLKPFTYQDPKTISRNGGALALLLLSIGAKRAISSIPPTMLFPLSICSRGGCTVPSAEGFPIIDRKEVT
jgi:hypothetical protein